MHRPAGGFETSRAAKRRGRSLQIEDGAFSPTPPLMPIKEKRKKRKEKTGQHVLVRSRPSCARSRLRSSNFTCDARKTSWGSGSGKALLSVPAFWVRAMTAKHKRGVGVSSRLQRQKYLRGLFMQRPPWRRRCVKTLTILRIVAGTFSWELP